MCLRQRWTQFTIDCLAAYKIAEIYSKAIVVEIRCRHCLVIVIQWKAEIALFGA